MPPVDRALCRKAAKECTELASVTSDPETRQLLLMRAQEWLKLTDLSPGISSKNG